MGLFNFFKKKPFGCAQEKLADKQTASSLVKILEVFTHSVITDIDKIRIPSINDLEDIYLQHANPKLTHLLINSEFIGSVNSTRYKTCIENLANFFKVAIANAMESRHTSVVPFILENYKMAYSTGAGNSADSISCLLTYLIDYFSNTIDDYECANNAFHRSMMDRLKREHIDYRVIRPGFILVSLDEATIQNCNRAKRFSAKGEPHESTGNNV